MKANRKFRSNQTAAVGPEAVAMIVSLLLTIIIGVMVYFSVTENISDFDDSASEIFTTDSDGNSFTMGSGSTLTSSSNYTGEMVELGSSVSSVTNITCYNSSAASESWATTQGTDYSVNGKYLSILADTTGATISQYDQLNVTYVSNIAETEGDTTDMADTVFALLPIIGLVMVAAIILAFVLGFGSGGKKGL